MFGKSNLATVSVIPLKGAIAANMGGGGFGQSKTLDFDTTEERIRRAFNVGGLKAVVLDINSPGGSPTQSAMIGDHIRYLAEKQGVPVYASAQDVAASGGYWLACAADEIYAAAPTSMIGSIGVISGGLAYPKLAKKLGIEQRIHTAGKSKSRMSPFEEEKPEDIEWLKGRLEETHNFFKQWVVERRGVKLNIEEFDLDNEIFTGDVWHAPQAHKIGLIDAIGAYKPALQKQFGESVRFKTFGPARSGGLISRFLSASTGATYTPENIGEQIVEAGLSAMKNEALWAPYTMR